MFLALTMPLSISGVIVCSQSKNIPLSLKTLIGAERQTKSGANDATHARGESEQSRLLSPPWRSRNANSLAGKSRQRRRAYFSYLPTAVGDTKQLIIMNKSCASTCTAFRTVLGRELFYSTLGHGAFPAHPLDFPGA